MTNQHVMGQKKNIDDSFGKKMMSEIRKKINLCGRVGFYKNKKFMNKTNKKLTRYLSPPNVFNLFLKYTIAP